MEAIPDIFFNLYEKWSGEEASEIKAISSAGSNRKYYRITGSEQSLIGTFNEDKKENEAFFHFSETFFKAGLNVPKIYSIDQSRTYYLQEDLGDRSLFMLRMSEAKDRLSENTKKLYEKSLDELIKFQIRGIEKIDLNYCYPRKAMDRQAFLWDLNYFKYYFLKPQNILFDEEKLEDDFHAFIDLLLKADQNHFIYRDFQTRNIIIKNDEPYFIDFQGGRKGALQYDLASVLYQVKAQIPDETKKEFIEHYLNELKKHKKISSEEFLAHFYPYVLIRLIQVMGAYGFRGLIEKRSHFLESIPLAVESLRNALPDFSFLDMLPELKKCILDLTRNSRAQKQTSDLLVHIKSFAYKNGIPKDESRHGEGFVFDCRALPNPGRLEQYQHLSGKDISVINYLKEHKEIFEFQDHVFQLADQSINNYIQRKFTNLTINFGCTGGQHRSVFFAENLAKHLREKYDINIKLTHTNQNNWKLKNDSYE